MSKEDRYSHLGGENGDESESEPDGGEVRAEETDEGEPDSESSVTDTSRNASSVTVDPDAVDGGVHVTIVDGEEAITLHIDDSDMTAAEVREAIQRDVDQISDRPRTAFGHGGRVSSSLTRPMVVAGVAALSVGAAGLAVARRVRQRSES